MNEKTHSKLGIASIFLAIGNWIYLTIIAFFLNSDSFSKIFDRFFSSNQSGMVKGFEDFSTAIIIGVFLLLIIPSFVHLVGFIFGIIGSFSKTKKRLFGNIGVILNVLPFVLSIVLYILGGT